MGKVYGDYAGIVTGAAGFIGAVIIAVLLSHDDALIGIASLKDSQRCRGSSTNPNVQNKGIDISEATLDANVYPAGIGFCASVRARGVNSVVATLLIRPKTS